MKAIVVMFDTLRKKSLPCYGNEHIIAPNFERLAEQSVTFDRFYAGSLPCIPARRELHTGRYNFLHRSWGPLEPFDGSVFETLKKADVYSHLVTDHGHYLEDGGATYHHRYNTWECFRGQEGDRWKPQIEDVTIPKQMDTCKKDVSMKQNWINRKYQQKESDMSMVKVFDAGLDFLDQHHDKDNWLLQVETFEPHEPFIVPQKYKDLYKDTYVGDVFQWPSYQPVTESPEAVEHLKLEYAALISMCDNYLGKILDKMDALNLWEDTLLIVNTDHGFLLDEHGWWGKNVQPFYNEVVELPFFIYNPKLGTKNQRCDTLSQTIDIPATILDFFQQPVDKTMEGKSLLGTIEDGQPIRESGLFGMHGGHVNIVDEAHIYMRSSVTAENQPLFNYTLMPTNIRNFFPRKRLMQATLTDEFDSTGNMPILKVPMNSFLTPYRFGHRLYDNVNDPGQLAPLEDAALELTMIEKLRQKLIESDAPKEQFQRLGIHEERCLTMEELLDQKQAYKDHYETPFKEQYKLDDSRTKQLLMIHDFLLPEGKEVFASKLEDFVKEYDQHLDEEGILSFFEEMTNYMIPAKKAVLKRHVRFAYKND